MVESLHFAIFLDAFEQHVGAKNIVFREDVRVAETQIHMRMRREMEHGIYVVLLQTSDHVFRSSHIAVKEVEIRLRLQHARIVERAAVVEFVERYDVVVIRVLDRQVADKPRATVIFLARSAGVWLYGTEAVFAVIRDAYLCLHEALSASHQDVLHV